MLIVLDRLEYNSNPAYSSHSVRMPDSDEDAMSPALRDKGIPFSHIIHENLDKDTGYTPPYPKRSKPCFGPVKRRITPRRKRQKNSALYRGISPDCSNWRERNGSISKTKTHREQQPMSAAPSKSLNYVFVSC